MAVLPHWVRHTAAETAARASDWGTRRETRLKLGRYIEKVVG